jgi:hypothetical protein
MLIEKVEFSWANIASYGGAGTLGTHIHWGSGTDALVRKLRIISLGGDELTNEGDMITGGAHKHYGKDYKLGDAGGAPVSASGTDQAGATEARYVHTVITGGTGGVRLKPSSFGVEHGTVINMTGVSVNIYPPVSGTFNQGGLAANDPITLGPMSKLDWYFDGTYFYGL